MNFEEQCLEYLGTRRLWLVGIYETKILLFNNYENLINNFYNKVRRIYVCSTNKEVINSVVNKKTIKIKSLPIDKTHPLLGYYIASKVNYIIDEKATLNDIERYFPILRWVIYRKNLQGKIITTNPDCYKLEKKYPIKIEQYKDLYIITVDGKIEVQNEICTSSSNNKRRINQKIY